MYNINTTNGLVPLENTTGKQATNAKGWFSGHSSSNSVIGSNHFSSTAYWENTVSNHPSYVYNENSYLYEYVENYKQYLETVGARINNARLITTEELESIGCSMNDKGCWSAPTWVYQTSYWTTDSYSSASIWYVDKNGGLSGGGYYSDVLGIRPLIEIDIDEILPQIATLTTGNLGDVGSEICIENECFYTVTSNNDSIILLSKYNLHVGNRHDGINGTIPLENPTGIQNEKAIGWFGNNYSADNPIIGTKPFSDTYYWSSLTSYPAYVYNENSNLYEYVENYKRYLEGLGAKINEARLINMQELENLGCVSASNSCSNAPSWVYLTTYRTGEAYTATSIWSNAPSWVYLTTYRTGEAYTATSIWSIYSNGAFNGYNDSNKLAGVRPVIIIPKSTVRKVINIKIEGTTYQALENMTWSEWIESKYNTLNLYITIYNNKAYISNTSDVRYKHIVENNKGVYITQTPEDYIVANKEYKLSSPSAGN